MDNEGPATHAPSSSAGANRTHAQGPRGPAGQFNQFQQQGSGPQQGGYVPHGQQQQGQYPPRGGAGRGQFQQGQFQGQGQQLPYQQQRAPRGEPRGAPRGAVPRGPPQINDTASYNPYATPILPQMYPQYLPVQDPAMMQPGAYPVPMMMNGSWVAPVPAPPALVVPAGFQPVPDGQQQPFPTDGNPETFYNSSAQNVPLQETHQQFIPQQVTIRA